MAKRDRAGKTEVRHLGWWCLSFPGDHGAEIGLEGYECPEPWDCHCIAAERAGGEVRRCGSTVPEAQQEVVEFYRMRAAYYEGMTPEKFLASMGYLEEAGCGVD